MKINYSISELKNIMIAKGITDLDCKKVCEILSKCDVQYVQLKLTEQTLRAEMPLATPIEIKHDGIVIIKHKEQDVIIFYEKNKDFIAEIKSLGFRWDWDKSYWYMHTSERTGTIENVIANTGNHLLNAGFSVRFETQDILDAAVNGEYEPICNKWIDNIEGYFVITWGHDEELYKVINSLPGAKYDKKNYSIKVPERSLDAILDFIGQYKYKITQKAKIRIEKLRTDDYKVTPKNKNNFDILEDLKDK